MEISGDKIKGWVYLAILAVVLIVIVSILGWLNKLKTDPKAAQDFADNHPNLAAFLISAGLWSDSGQKVPDTTGVVGTSISNAYQTGTYLHSQGAYDVALSNYAHAHGFPTSLSAQGTEGWPWKSYSEWIISGQDATQLPK